jgi:hypothetical protein
MERLRPSHTQIRVSTAMLTTDLPKVDQTLPPQELEPKKQDMSYTSQLDFQVSTSILLNTAQTSTRE